MGHLHRRAPILVSPCKHNLAVVNDRIDVKNFARNETSQQVVTRALTKILTLVHLIYRAPHPPTPRTQPPPEGAAAIQRVPRPTPPDAPRATPPQAAPAAAVQRPAPPVVAQPPGAAGPTPGAPPAQQQVKPAAPPPGGPPKCVLPNGQPCPRP